MMIARHLLCVPPLRAEGGGTRGKISYRAQDGSVRTWCFLLVGLTMWLSLSAGCSSLPASVVALATGEAPPDPDPTYTGRQHFPVSPDEALAVLRDVAPQQGWTVVSTGEEYDTHGQRGRFFRLDPPKRNSEPQTVSGVFYAEPSGSYVRISEHNGLPETLIEPLIMEIKKQKGYRQ
jgi:hypothetical protein